LFVEFLFKLFLKSSCNNGGGTKFKKGGSGGGINYKLGGGGGKDKLEVNVGGEGSIK
jgi:hypothetical protein